MAGRLPLLTLTETPNMKNLWPDAFSENDLPAAKSLLEEQAKLLFKLTNGTVYAAVSELSALDSIPSSMRNDFSYRFDIRGKFLEGYRFTALLFSHDITLYPVKFRVDEKIGAELGIKKNIIEGFMTQIDTPEALETFLGRVLSSERLKTVVGSIMRLSK